jgi:hypothetical protein
MNNVMRHQVPDSMQGAANGDTNAAQIYNSLILSYIVLFFSNQDLFPALADGVSLEQLSHGKGLDRKRLQAVLETTVTLGVLTQTESTPVYYTLTPLGHDLAKNRGFFTWAIGGYSPLLENMATFITAPGTNSLPYVRGGNVAIGSDECNQTLMEPIFKHVIDSLPVSRMADLGCGNAGRLINVLNRRPGLTGVGVDINTDAITTAETNRDQHGLTSRLELVRENVFTSLNDSRPEFQDVELVMSFMMLHDLFNIQEFENNLFDKLKAAFPQAKYFVLADTCTDEEERTFETMPVFAAGFELIHTLRGIKTFPLGYYLDRFERSGLKLRGQYKFGVPNTYIFVLEV